VRLRQLEYLIAICEQGSFSAASQRLLVAQPSLSQQIRALEHELGAELFERGRHGVALTPAGRVFLPHARAVIAATEAARASIADLVNGRLGELHVLTIRSVASGILPGSIARWHDLFPGIVLRLHDYSHRRDLEDAVREGRGDLAIGPRPPDWDGEIVSLGFESLVVAGGGPYGDETAKVEDLAAGEWVLFEPEQGMSEVLDWMAYKLRFKPRVAARVGQVAAALNLAIEGVGLAVVPENAVPHAWRNRVRRFKPPLYREIVAYSRSSSLPQLARRYVELLGSVELPLTRTEDIEHDAFTR
jgi:DNA-binding transcriptional LysR family regulator